MAEAGEEKGRVLQNIGGSGSAPRCHAAEILGRIPGHVGLRKLACLLDWGNGCRGESSKRTESAREMRTKAAPGSDAIR